MSEHIVVERHGSGPPKTHAEGRMHVIHHRVRPLCTSWADFTTWNCVVRLRRTARRANSRRAVGGISAVCACATVFGRVTCSGPMAEVFRVGNLPGAFVRQELCMEHLCTRAGI